MYRIIDIAKMKGIIFVILTIIAKINSDESPELPAGCYDASIPAEKCCSMPESWMESIPNPNDCYSFYTCLVGHPVHMDCLDGQHWSIKERTCVDPEFSECKFATTTTTTAIPIGICRNIPKSCRHGVFDPEMCCKGIPDYEFGLLQNKDDCTTYYQCVHWKPVLQHCPEKLEWNADTCRCEWGESLTCKPK